MSRSSGTSRRCRAEPRDAAGLRPTDVVGAYFVLGLAFFLAGALVGVLNAVEPWAHGRWLAMHLVFVGGISQLVLGASQFFAGAFLATDPPPRAVIRAQIATWNLGAVVLAVGVSVDSDPLIAAAALSLLAGLGAYSWSLMTLKRRSLGQAPWATRWYLAGAAAFAIGIVAGVALAVPIRWPYGDLLAGHMALNLAGWFGAAIVGTLHTFLPSLLKTTLRFPRLQEPTFASWVLGVAMLAIGYAFDLDELAVAGWIGVASGALLLVANVVGCLHATTQPLTLPASAVAAAQGFLLAGVALAAVTAASNGPADALAGSNRGAVALLMVAGWIGLTVLGSLVHLLAVVVRVRDLRRPMPLPSSRWGTPVVALAMIGVYGLAASRLADLSPLAPVAAVALIGSYGVLVAFVSGLALKVLARARPRV